MTDEADAHRNRAPADELAEIRAEIKALKERETALRTRILESDTPDVLMGVEHEVVVREQRSRVLDKSLLPEDIRENPAFYRERVTRIVTVKPKAGSPSTPEESLIDDDDR